jgi:hypothetical protein
MEPAERAQTYAALAESTRRLVALMDGKAGFLFAANGALLTFMWSSLLALLAALWVVIPRRSIALPGSDRGDYRPISFYGYVATHYAATEFRRFEQEVAQFDTADFSREALAEHFMVSRIVKNKTAWVTISGALTFASMALAGAALLVKTVYG